MSTFATTLIQEMVVYFIILSSFFNNKLDFYIFARIYNVE